MSYYENRINKRIKEYPLLPTDVREKLEKALPRGETTQKKDISFVSSLAHIQEDAKEFAESWNKSVDEVKIEHSCYQLDYSDSWSSEVHLTVQGLETNDQYYARLMEYYENAKIRDEYDRREFERLKAKFK